MKDYYGEIDKGLREYEEHRSYHHWSMDWFANRIEWCWKWRKITKEQMEELAGRASAIFEGDYKFY